MKAIVLTLLLCAITAQLSAARIRVHVVSEDDGAPVTNALVSSVFSTLAVGGGTPIKRIVTESRTDADGNCCFSGASFDKSVGFLVKRKDQVYYGASTNLDYTSLKPWSVVTIPVIRFGTPTPLIVKEAKVNFDDVEGESCDVAEFDMLKCDWLPPRGEGMVADVVLKRKPVGVVGSVKDHDGKTHVLKRYEMEVSFPGKGNGMVRFQADKDRSLKCRSAPASGYENPLVLWEYSDEELNWHDNFRDEPLRFCFRIRSLWGSDGKLIGCHYGKSYGGFALSRYYDGGKDGVCRGIIKYYVNPISTDPNLELDRNLEAQQRVGDSNSTYEP